MIKRDLLQRLLKKVAEDNISENDTPKKAVYQKRYYLYNAPVNGSIPFGRINEVLTQGSPEQRKEIADKLKGGSSKYQADYFYWERMYLVTDYYDPNRKNLIVYEASLNSDGSKQDMVSKVYPNNAAVTSETVEQDFLLFTTANQSSNVINFDSVAENLFINVSDNDVSDAVQTLFRREDLPNAQNMNTFKSLFNEYRLWSRMESRLLFPDLTDPQNVRQDGVPGRYYPGGEAAFAYIMKQTGNQNLYQPKPVVPGPEQEKAENKPPQPQEEQKENIPQFEPAGPTKPVKGDIVNKNERFMMAQDNRIIRMARNATFNFLRNADISSYQSVGNSDSKDDEDMTAKDIKDRIKRNEQENSILKRTEGELKHLENTQNKR